MEPFRLQVAPSAARSFLRLPERAAWAVASFLGGDLIEKPYRVGKPLRNEFEGWRCARRGAYRVVYRIDEPSRTIVIERIDHRADVYRPR